MEVRIIRSSRKTMELQVKPGGEVVVRCNQRASRKSIDQFIQKNMEWIVKQQARARAAAAAQEQVVPFTEAEMAELKRRAKAYIPARTAEISRKMGISYGRVAIRAQKTRWGSCSSQGNLNFNCLLMLTSKELIDYVIVHELAHRREMNHSPRFWALVGQYIPDYQVRRRQLKEIGMALIPRLPQ